MCDSPWHNQLQLTAPTSRRVPPSANNWSREMDAADPIQLAHKSKMRPSSKIPSRWSR